MGHHIYYSKLNNTLIQSASQQSWALRIGTGLAFAIKTGLTVVVRIAGTQQLWLTLQRKAVRINDIDCLFIPMSNPTTLFRPGVLAHTKTLCMFVLVSCYVYIPFLMSRLLQYFLLLIREVLANLH